MKLAGLAAAAALALGGCVFQDVKEQLQKIGTHCSIEGRASTANGPDRSIVVVLFRRGGPGGAATWGIADHFVMEHEGRWSFLVPPGPYAVAAFEDANHDRVYQPTEPHVRAAFEKPMECAAGGRIAATAALAGRSPAIPRSSWSRCGRVTPSAQGNPRREDRCRRHRSELRTRASASHREDGMWRPLDFVVEGPRNLPRPFDARGAGTLRSRHQQLPVVFARCRKLDRRRFQPWFHYPRGRPRARGRAPRPDVRQVAGAVPLPALRRGGPQHGRARVARRVAPRRHGRRAPALCHHRHALGRQRGRPPA